jgi:hypothetical protein
VASLRIRDPGEIVGRRLVAVSLPVWASRISGAAYAAWVENARLSRMNG